MKNFLSNISKKQKQNIIIGFIVVVIAYFLYQAYKKRKYTTVPFDANNIPKIQTGTTTEISWNPEPLAREIFTNIEGYNLMVYPETSEKILDLNKDQTIYLYNYYNKYLAQEYPTLTKLFASEWNQKQGKYDQVVSKLKAYGLE